ncbi:MAG: hypothetical protein M1828_004379 [Chrysothrix sp. TS-e1954]|nr:MAG: hypothetical protein M1828_004379 [Chrysothrix sp. TS-e1954]
MSLHRRTISSDRDNLLPPSRSGKDGRQTGGSSAPGSKGPGSFIPSVGHSASYTSESTSMSTPRGDNSKQDYFGTVSNYRGIRLDDDEKALSKQKQAEYREAISREMKIKIGSENLLEALNFKSAKQAKGQRMKVEDELKSSNRKIARLKLDLEQEIQRVDQPSPPQSGRLSQLFQNAREETSFKALQYGDEAAFDESESPTFILAEILQNLEIQGLPPDYYVEHANNLIVLFKKYQTLKYDLVWSIFGLRVQSMLLSDSREVAAAGYRMMRYAMTDRKSLSFMRSFGTDTFVILSLVKETKASVEREQALKFVRAFLDVKDGIAEISRAVVRTLVAIAEQGDDRMKHICILTLAEVLIRDASLVVSANGITLLADALAEGQHYPCESLTHAFLFLLETPERRRHLSSGYEIEGPFSAFTDVTAHSSEQRLKANASVIACLLKSWQGITALSSNGFNAIKSLTGALYLPSTTVRNVVLELVLDVLRIHPPSWSSSFLAGRRLTTYGAVPAVQREAPKTSWHGQENNEDNAFVDHFRAITLAVLLHCGLQQALLHTVQAEPEPSVKRKATLLLGESLSLLNTLLPETWSSSMQVLPDLFSAASMIGSASRSLASNTIYQIESVNRTLYRSNPRARMQAYDFDTASSLASMRRPSDLQRDTLTAQIEEGPFRAIMAETQVLSSFRYNEWRWPLIQKIIEGPLLNPRRLDEAIKTTKFIKRLVGFFRPFKFRFSAVPNTKINQHRYTRAGCSLIRSLLQTDEGVRYLQENKLIRQIAECLAQVDTASGLTSASPLFSEKRMSDTLTCGYLDLLGEVSVHGQGLAMMERWKMMNMLYHIVELQDRDDLVRSLLSNLDYTRDSHLRVVLSKALTSTSKQIRIFSTRVLRKYAIKKLSDTDASSNNGCAEWAIDLLVTQLYDPEVEVCEASIKILEAACSDMYSLEYVVRCRPALDHLGEIAAPLLLRFLSTSIGYHYLDGLDYISQEMDDWFLGRNDKYVSLIEASLTRALSVSPDAAVNAAEEPQEDQVNTAAPLHFYRELTRTDEGCRLLMNKGHFAEFAAAIRNWGLEDSEPETVLKVKAAMWAVGNIASMEYGSPFLEDSDVVDLLIGIAEDSDIMSMKGTAVFVLGLISKSVHGQEILAEHGWDVTMDDMGESLGICLPLDLSKLFKVSTHDPLQARTLLNAEQVKPTTADMHAGQTSAIAENQVVTDQDATNARILALIKDLGNTVLTKTRAGELHNIKAKKPPGFQSPALFKKVMAVLDQHHFRLPALRFVIDLFDKDVLRRTVLEDSEDDDEGDTTIREALPSPARALLSSP